MEISGLVKTSLIDYPGKVAAVVFTQGCNFRCGFCHNPDLLEIGKGRLSEKEFWQFLSSRKGKLDGVVITGGEPLVQKGIKPFVQKIRSKGFLVKLDTNGTNPKLLASLIEENLLDYVAMDIKGPLEKYQKISKFVNTKVIQESINILKNSKIKYEFRTTVLPYYHTLEDFNKIGKLIDGAETFTLQNFRPDIVYDEKLKMTKRFNRKDLEKIAETMEKYVGKVIIHINMD